MMGDDLKATLVKALLALALLGIIGSTCAGWAAQRVRSAYDHAAQVAERDSSRARARRHEALAREKFAVAESKAHVADSVAAIATRAANRAIAHRAQLAGVEVAPVVAEQLALDAAAIDSLLRVAPAYAVSIESFRPAVASALVAVGESQRADTLSQALGEQAEKSAHWRGVRQGIKGTVVTGAVLIIVGALLHAGGKV